MSDPQSTVSEAPPERPAWREPGEDRREHYRSAAYRHDPRSKSAVLAGVLSLMPGLGQVYVGYYQRGFIHIVVVASIIALLNSEAILGLEPFFGLFLAFFWMYNCVDAARRAALYNQALHGESPIRPPDDVLPGSIGGSVAGGSVLIVAGAVLLMRTRFGMSLDWLQEWWPAIPMLFGVYLVAKSIMARRAAD